MTTIMQQVRQFPDLFGRVGLCVPAGVALVLWIAEHLRAEEAVSGLRGLLRGLAHAAVGFAALFLTAQAARQWIVLATPWPIWLVALAGAVVTEALLALYGVERRTISRRMGRALVTLRILLALLVLAMLCQPVLRTDRQEGVRRYVAVLVDRSASMQVPDTALSVPEKVRLADLLLAGRIGRPHAIETVVRELRAVGAEVDTLGQWLAMVRGQGPELAQRHLATGRQNLARKLDAAHEAVSRQFEVLDRVLDGPPGQDEATRAAAAELKARLAEAVAAGLKEAAELTKQADESVLAARAGRLSEIVAAVQSGLVRLTGDAAKLADRLDEAYYASAAEERRAMIDEVSRRTRLELARRLLLGGDEGAGGLLGPLKAAYGVRVYSFALEANETDVTAQPALGEAGDLGTNMAAALQQAMTDLPGEQLAGVVVLTDGRHNAADPVEPLAARLGLRNVPVCSVVIGSERPPRDAAIVSLEAPETVCAEDKLYVEAQVKLDGMAGREATVMLARADTVVHSETIKVPTDQYRARVELVDVPTQTGLYSYRVVVSAGEDEVVLSNNEFPITVSVTHERTNLLIIEGRPRWEFRYLKNLFAGRDKTVKLQYVLFEPDRVEGEAARPRIPASVSAPDDRAAATALPESELEWLKFDAIVLGDVDPTMLGAADREALRRFVVDRGGTLIAIAGPEFMPHAYVGSPLEEILPVRVGALSEGYAKSPDTAFRLALTAQGRDSVLMRQTTDPEENARVWDSLPPIRWRYPILGTKPGATVLAYAVPEPSSPDAAGEEGPAEGGAPEDRRRFERTHALIAVHNVALGRVVFFAFDRTWRLRYRAGDVRHHRFWGQMLRWATANKLPAGTALVKLGTDRPRYALHSRVLVRARIMRADLTPLVSNEVVALLSRDGQFLLRKRMTYDGEVPGSYRADLGELPSGTYSVQVTGPEVDAILAADGTEAVSTEFSVAPSSSMELTELAADPDLPKRLAEVSGGVVVAAAEALEVMKALGPPVLVRREREERALWSSWQLLGLMLLAASSEWLLRKKAGLP